MDEKEKKALTFKIADLLLKEGYYEHDSIARCKLARLLTTIIDYDEKDDSFYDKITKNIDNGI